MDCKGLNVKRIECKNGILEVPFYSIAFHKRLEFYTDKICVLLRKTSKKREKNLDVDYHLYCRKIGEYFDAIFGKGAAVIVFGGQEVSHEMYEEFLTKFMKLAVKWASKDISN